MRISPIAAQNVYIPKRNTSPEILKPYQDTVLFAGKSNKEDDTNSLFKIKYRLAKTMLMDEMCPKEKIYPILKSINKDNITLAQEVINNGYPYRHLPKILKFTTKENIDVVKLLYHNDNHGSFSDIPKILNSHNIELAKELCLDDNFPKYLLFETLKIANKKTVDYIRELYKDKNFYKEDIPRVISPNDDILEFSKELYRNNKIHKYKIAGIISETKDYNLDLAKELCNKDGFSVNEIPKILRNTTPLNIEFAKEICDNNKIPKDCISDILKQTNKDNIEYARKLCNDSKILKQHIPDLLEYNSDITEKKLLHLYHTMGKNNAILLYGKQLSLACNLINFYNKTNFLNIPLEDKKKLLTVITSSDYSYNFGKYIMGKYFPLLPKNEKDYSLILSQLVDSIRSEIKPLSKEKIEKFNQALLDLSTETEINSKRAESNNFRRSTAWNNIIECLPELDKNTTKKDFQNLIVQLQKINKDPEYKKLNNSDKKILMLTTFSHYLSSSNDTNFEKNTSREALFIAQKFNLTKQETIKLYTLIKNHEWLNKVYFSNSKAEEIKSINSAAYDLHPDNMFDMMKIYTLSRGYNPKNKELAELEKAVYELRKTQPLLPQTKIPSASRINQAISKVYPDGKTNIKGVYKDGFGLIIIKYNEVEDWEKIGFPKGSISQGIKTRSYLKKINTGNIKFFVHGLNKESELAKFDAFSLIDSDALLSVSYAERPESNYEFFRPQGVILDVNANYVHGGGYNNSGSGNKKTIQDFKNNYIFGGERELDRKYISKIIKKATGMNDKEYIEFFNKYKNKPFTEIEPIKTREQIIKALSKINSTFIKDHITYNEMYISNPNKVMAVYAYNKGRDNLTPNNAEYDDPILFLYHPKVQLRTHFLREYALKRDLPFILFGG